MAKRGNDESTKVLLAASKEVVSSTRKLATAMCEMSLAPAAALMEQDPSTGALLGPWIEGTRTTQDWLWATWESAANQAIDQRCALFERARV